MRDDHTAVLARVTGTVQGVGFRVWTRREAERLGLTGWVRNEADGSVTALVTGPGDRVMQMLAALRQGPPGASVVAVETTAASGEPHARFEIRG